MATRELGALAIRFKALQRDRVVVITAVFATHTPEVLRAKDWNIAEKAALAFSIFAAHILIVNIIEVVFLIAMATEALTGRTDCLAVCSSLHVTPINIEAVLAGFTYTRLIRLKLSFTHHSTAVICADNLFILEVRLDMSGCLAIHH